MKVVVNEAAARDLDGIIDWISKDNPRGAVATMRRIGERLGYACLTKLRKLRI